MSAAIRAELRKVLSTRTWWVLLLAMAAFLAILAGFFAFSLTSTGGGFDLSQFSDPTDPSRTVYSLATSVGYLVPLIIGSLLMTSEYRHGTLTPSLLAEPRRSRVLAAKTVVAALLGVVYGVVAVAATVAAGAPVLAARGSGAQLGEPDVQRLLAVAVLVMVLWTVVGLGIGGLLTNQVAAIVAVIAFTRLIEPIARLALAPFEATAAVAQFLPGAAADGLQGTSFYTQLDAGTDLLPPWAGGLVLAGYALTLLVLTRLITLRRDIG